MPNPVTDIEERQAWDQYVAAQLSIFEGRMSDELLDEVALDADRMIERRRKRFGDGK